MARSDYIYLVRSGDLLSQGAVPVAAFTVKRELRAWLLARPDETLRELEVYRLHDGGHGAVVQMDIHDIIS